MQTKIEEMLALRCVADVGSISAAAELLGQTASAVSRTLSRLERKLGVTLLWRTTRRLTLTAEGEIFLGHARQILDAVETAESQLQLRHQQPSGRLRVNAAAPFMLHAVVPLIPEFQRQYPQISLELDTDDDFIDLLAQDTDVAIRIGELRDSTLHARYLGNNTRQIVASPTYLARCGRPQTVAALLEHTLIGFGQPDTLNRWPLRHANGESLHITPNIRVSSGETLRALALQGCGVACLSDFMTQADLAAGRLETLLVPFTLDVRQPIHAVYYRHAALAPRISCFLDFLEAHL